MQIADKLRAQQGEHLFAHLQAAVARVDAVDKCQRFIAIIIVERNHNGEDVTAREDGIAVDVMTRP